MSDSKLHFSRDGIHTHLVLPSALLLLYVPDLKRYLEPYAWARVGWGDYAYYGAAHQPLRLALRALLVPTAAVIAVRGLASFGEPVSQQQRTYSLNTRGLKAAGMRCWPLFSFLPSQVEKSVLNNGYTAI